MSLVAGIHPVREALKAGRPLDRVHIVKGLGGPRLQEIVELARSLNIPVRFETREQIDRLAPGAAHQGVIALGAARQTATLEKLNPARDRLVIVLDGVEDPHNLGAIVRTANAAGAGAVIIPERRAAPLTEVVAKAAAGALEYTPVIRVTNLNRTLEKLKELGYWIYGLDERGKAVYSETKFNTPTAFVMGGEGKGLHQLVEKNCDLLLRIPLAGDISSLNVSVAAGIILFEWRRRQSISRESS